MTMERIPVDLKKITEQRLTYRKIPCELIVAGHRKERNAFFISLLSEAEETEFFTLIDLEKKRMELNLMKTKIEQALRLENSMEIV